MRAMFAKYWVDPDTGYACVIVRNPHLGHLCGYVGVPDDHLAYGKDYDDDIFNAVMVHGGLTFSGFRQATAGEPTDLWWLGFDCAHYGDFVPNMPVCIGTVYRDVGYVTNEVTMLAKQLKALQHTDDQ